MVDRDELKDSEYDGIQEYDNDLPRWWVMLFWLTIIWAICYAAWFHFPSTPTPEQRLAMGMEEIKARQAKHAPALAVDPREEDRMLTTLANNKEVLASGSTIYAGKCLPCHGAQGQGLVGPNLTDDFWVHGGKPSEIKHVVVNGVLEKGMLSWKTMLTNDEINAVVAFILSIRGTNPAGAKAAEGIEVSR